MLFFIFFHLISPHPLGRGSWGGSGQLRTAVSSAVSPALDPSQAEHTNPPWIQTPRSQQEHPVTDPEQPQPHFLSELGSIPPASTQITALAAEPPLTSSHCQIPTRSTQKVTNRSGIKPTDIKHEMKGRHPPGQEKPQSHTLKVAPLCQGHPGGAAPLRASSSTAEPSEEPHSAHPG